MDSIRLGYACINTNLRKGPAATSVFCSRTVVMDTLKKVGPDEGAKLCKEKALQNIADLLTILKWNEQHGIRLFRITSCIFPHQGNHLLPEEFSRKRYFQGDIEFARRALEAVGAYAREMGHRLTAHSQPYLQLGTTNRGVLARTLFDLEVHEKIFTIMKVPDPVIIMHGGGFYQTPEHKDRAEAKRESMTRWVAQWKKLPLNLRRWVTLENDEKIYAISDLLPICERYGIQFCCDVFHNAISADRVEITPALLRRICTTWKGRPKFHLSEQDKALQFGAHAEMVKVIPDYLLRLRGIDIMVEAKWKEQAVLELYKKYFTPSKGARVTWKLK
jgi:UV DNA damage endonuclease